MDSQQTTTDSPANQSDQHHALSEAQANALLDQKHKQSTSGLSWDQVASDDHHGWRQITEMGEGD